MKRPRKPSKTRPITEHASGGELYGPNTTLRNRVLEVSGGVATWVASEPVRELWEGRVAWEGAVEVFDVVNGAAPRAFAWERVEEDGRRSQVVVLQRPPVVTARDAVRASVVAEYQQRRGETK
jgi:hypothetical protein